LKIKLTDRMQTIASMVIKDGSVADIGTDHGYIPAFLISEGICPEAILCDIAEDPLSHARRNFEKFGLEGDFRCGPGLEVLKKGEVSTVIIAGMGGETIMDILGKDPEKSHSYKRLILQPRTFIGELRLWLLENGYRFVDYGLCRERDLINEVMAVEPSESGSCTEEAWNMKREELFSSFLLEKGDPLLEEYLEIRLKNKKEILSQVLNSKKDRSDIETNLRSDISVLEEMQRSIRDR